MHLLLQIADGHAIFGYKILCRVDEIWPALGRAQQFHNFYTKLRLDVNYYTRMYIPYAAKATIKRSGPMWLRVMWLRAGMLTFSSTSCEGWTTREAARNIASRWLSMPSLFPRSCSLYLALLMFPPFRNVSARFQCALMLLRLAARSRFVPAPPPNRRVSSMP